MQRINATLRFQLNDGTEVPQFPNPITNSTISYSHWNSWHYSANLWVACTLSSSRCSGEMLSLWFVARLDYCAVGSATCDGRTGGTGPRLGLFLCPAGLRVAPFHTRTVSAAAGTTPP
jgi:hypothetical protein